ncbi:MAG: hypothetical protein IPF54_09905 [Draconibacterium sp.]|nr:hypothetical protein [Draconibacterium sp.]
MNPSLGNGQHLLYFTQLLSRGLQLLWFIILVIYSFKVIQEIITYMIIGAAIALAISKAVRKFRVKRKPSKKVDFKKDTISLHHDCSDCSAECMLRDAVKPCNKGRN